MQAIPRDMFQNCVTAGAVVHKYHQQDANTYRTNKFRVLNIKLKKIKVVIQL